MIGILDTNGEFFDCNKYYHKDLAIELVEKKNLYDDLCKFRQSKGYYSLALDFLLDINYIIFAGNVIVRKGGKLPEKQKVYLESLTKRNDLSKQLIDTILEELKKDHSL